MIKGDRYAAIDAHVLNCRLHHQNQLKYSVTIKHNKDQYASTQYKEHSNLIVKMDSHLIIYVDKYSFQHFPKLNLIINSIDHNHQIKTIGTAFAHYKKEGIQTYKISECSCKDKAFQLDIAFTFKILQVKNSSQKKKSKQIIIIKKQKFFSQSNTPRHSRQDNKPRFTSVQKQQQGKGVTEMRMIDAQHENKCQNNLIYVQKPQCMHNQQIVKLQSQSRRLKLQLCLAQQLLQLQQQKHRSAIIYIKYFEDLMQLTNNRTIEKVNNSFRIIEQQDEILQINEQLTDQLQRQTKSNQQLRASLQIIKSQNSILRLQLQKLQQDHQRSHRNYLEQQNADHKTQQIFHKIQQSKHKRKHNLSVVSKTVHYHLQLYNKALMIESRGKGHQEAVNNETNVLLVQRAKLQGIIQDLKRQIDKLMKEKIKQKISTPSLDVIKKISSQKDLKYNIKPPINKKSKRQEQINIKKDKFSKQKLKINIKATKRGGDSSNTNPSSNGTTTLKSLSSNSQTIANDGYKTIGGTSSNYFKIQKQSQGNAESQIKSQNNVRKVVDL